MAEEKYDAKELKELLEAVSTEIPKLLESVSNTLYRTENAEVLAKSVATFYKQMKEAGMDDKKAFELTQQYMSNYSLGGMISSAIGGAAKRKEHDDEDEE